MKKSKLILSFYIGMISLAVASVSLSVAWYVAARNLYINSIDITIDADRDLKISREKDGEYVDHISESDAGADKVFIPVTSAYSSSWKAEKKDMPVFYDESKFSDEEHTDCKSIANHGYFSKKYYFKADDDLYVTINPEKTFIASNKLKNQELAHNLYVEYQTFQEEYYKDLTEEEIFERLNRIVDAMRFSILIKDGDEYTYTIIDPYYDEVEGDTVYGGLLDNDVDQYYDYYLVDGSTDTYRERAYGELIADPSGYYTDVSSEDSGRTDPSDAPSAFNARHKKGIQKFDINKAKEDGIFAVEDAIALEEFKNPKKPFHFPVYRNTPKEVVISMYIEGWDLKSVNYNMGAAFTADLSFMIEREK